MRRRWSCGRHRCGGADAAAVRRRADGEVGLDHNETRSWRGWHRHTALVMLAFAMTAAMPTSKPPKNASLEGEDAAATELIR